MEPSASCASGSRIAGNPRFALITVIGSAMSLFCMSWVPVSEQTGALGVLVSAVIGFLAAYVDRQRAKTDPHGGTVDASKASSLLCDHPELLVAHRALTHALIELAGYSDEVFREAAAAKLALVHEEMRSLAQGKVIFSGTEAWRTVYERLLRSPNVRLYRSVAWIRSEDYWQDAPGQRSMQLNYDLLREGVRIERIAILCDFFWPPASLLPTAEICRWIDEQYTRGVWIGLVRESHLEPEPDLLCDTGVYGDRATGLWELDGQCRTSRFTFDFSREGLQLAEVRWRRLALYAVSYTDLLERAARGA
jgi:hypothetical protein